jgi:hypothetical protein
MNGICIDWMDAAAAVLSTKLKAVLAANEEDIATYLTPTSILELKWPTVEWIMGRLFTRLHVADIQSTITYRIQARIDESSQSLAVRQTQERSHRHLLSSMCLQRAKELGYAAAVLPPSGWLFHSIVVALIHCCH